MVYILHFLDNINALLSEIWKIIGSKQKISINPTGKKEKEIVLYELTTSDRFIDLDENGNMVIS